MGLGRKLVNISAKARGQQPLKFEIEIVPYFAGDIPAGINNVLFAWERGTKLFVTEAEPVHPKTRAVFWKQYLRQGATIYKDGNGMLPKEYSFKLQSVSKGSKGEQERKTIGKTKVDLAQFCTCQLEPQPQDVFLQLKPAGKIKVSVKATWLKDAQFDADAQTEVTEMTEMSGTSKPRSRHHRSHSGYGAGGGEEYDEQDLSGFDHHHGEASIPEEGPEGGEGGEGSGRRKKKKKNRRQTLPDEIPEGFELPPDPEELRRIKEEKALADEAAAEEEYRRQVEEREAAARAEAGLRLHKPGWRDYICCCCGPSMAAVDVHETSPMLSDKQAHDMEEQNAPVKKKKKKKHKRPHAALPSDVPEGEGEGGEEEEESGRSRGRDWDRRGGYDDGEEGQGGGWEGEGSGRSGGRGGGRRNRQ